MAKKAKGNRVQVILEALKMKESGLSLNISLCDDEES